MQDVQKYMLDQILDDFTASGDREAAFDQLSLLHTMHNQKVVGVIYRAKENNPLPGDEGNNRRVEIKSLDSERRFAAQEDKGEGRLQYWERIGLAYSGPDQTLPPDIMYLGDGMLVNCSDELVLGAHKDPHKPSITIGSMDNYGLLTLAFDNKENLDQVIEVLQGLSENMEPPCSSSKVE